MSIQETLNILACDNFRKQADYDYISARNNYRMELRQQFLWMCQQAIEKYLKAILLFNGLSSRYINIEIRKGKNIEFGHDLVKLFSKIKQIDYLHFSFDAEIVKFLEYLNDFGAKNRYMSYFSYVDSRAIQTLDKAVWHIRKYCRNFNIEILSDGQRINIRDQLIKQILSPEFINHSSKYKIASGELEKILRKPKKNHARISLVWANRYFSDRIRKGVKFVSYASSEIPPQNRDWFKNEVDRNEIEKYIKF